MSSTIPDTEKKLNYECFRCIIQKLEVNFRFQLIERLPKLNLAEKAVPLYISKLSIYEEGFELNDTKYQLGVIRQSREGPNPEIIENDNRRGGTEIDFDRFGFEYFSLPELTPGDILIQDPDCRVAHLFLERFETVNTRLVESRNSLISLEKEKLELEGAPEEVGNIPGNHVEIESEQLDRERNVGICREERLQRVNQSIRQVKRKLDDDEFASQRWQCKRNNLSSPYDMFIQFTKTSPDGTVHIERFNYDKRLMEARKYLICKFLGNRPVVIKIKSLGFWARLGGGLIIGLPERIKMDVQEFGTSGILSEVLQRVETILEHPNRPFARLESDNLRLEDAQNPKVQKAGVLMLFNIRYLDFAALCREIPNKRIEIIAGQEMQPRQFGVIVENLIDTKGTLGTCYEITVLREENKAKEVLRVVGERFENAVVGERLVTIPLPNQLQLDVSYASCQFNSSMLRYTIKMEVVQSRNNCIGL